jgi:hypothetical protein
MMDLTPTNPNYDSNYFSKETMGHNHHTTDGDESNNNQMHKEESRMEEIFLGDDLDFH